MGSKSLSPPLIDNVGGLPQNLSALTKEFVSNQFKHCRFALFDYHLDVHKNSMKMEFPRWRYESRSS